MVTARGLCCPPIGVASRESWSERPLLNGTLQAQRRAAEWLQTTAMPSLKEQVDALLEAYLQWITGWRVLARTLWTDATRPRAQTLRDTREAAFKDFADVIADLNVARGAPPADPFVYRGIIAAISEIGMALTEMPRVTEKDIQRARAAIIHMIVATLASQPVAIVKKSSTAISRLPATTRRAHCRDVCWRCRATFLCSFAGLVLGGLVAVRAGLAGLSRCGFTPRHAPLVGGQFLCRCFRIFGCREVELRLRRGGDRGHAPRRRRDTGGDNHTIVRRSGSTECGDRFGGHDLSTFAPAGEGPFSCKCRQRNTRTRRRRAHQVRHNPMAAAIPVAMRTRQRGRRKWDEAVSRGQLRPSCTPRRRHPRRRRAQRVLCSTFPSLHWEFRPRLGSRFPARSLAPGSAGPLAQRSTGACRRQPLLGPGLVGRCPECCRQPTCTSRQPSTELHSGSHSLAMAKLFRMIPNYMR